MNNEIKSNENLDGETIMGLVYEMQEAIKERAMVQMKLRNADEYIAHMQERFKKLNDRYPGIFQMIITREGDIDINRLKWMLDMVDNIHSGHIEKDVADKQVGAHLFNTYVDQHIDHDLEKNGPRQ